MENDIYAEFGRLLVGQMKDTFRANSAVNIEIGFMTSNLGLKLRRFKEEIPKGSYDLSRRLTVNDVEAEYTTSENGQQKHCHTVKISRPDGLKCLATGDRVIVVWDGTQPIIIDVIVAGNAF